MKPVAVSSSRAPKPKGFYSQAVRCGSLLFSAGQLPVDPESGESVQGSVEEQTERVIENIRGILEENGSSLASVLKVSVFLRDIASWGSVNEVYSRYFTGTLPPARTVVGGVDIHYGLAVEMDVVAHIPGEDGA
jgi:2-iminobutanoate/2-iminopropanoate deaminase